MLRKYRIIVLITLTIFLFSLRYIVEEVLNIRTEILSELLNAKFGTGCFTETLSIYRIRP